MAEEPSAEWPALQAEKDLRDFIEVEKQFVQAEHNLQHRLHSWHNVVGHLMEIVPDEDPLSDLRDEIFAILFDIDEVLEQDSHRDLRIETEEEDILKRLKRDIEHRNWRATRKEAAEGKGIEEKTVRVHARELKELHAHFIKLMRTIKESKLVPAIEEDLHLPKPVKDQASGHFLGLYKLARAYERIFRHLWRKEQSLQSK